MEWILENWIFILFAALFIGMHLFGFGCGGHGKHGDHGGHGEDKGHSGHMHGEEGPDKKKGGGSCH